MSLTFIRSFVLAGALGAALLGAGLAQAADGDPPVDTPVEIGAVAPAGDYENETDFFYAAPGTVEKAALEQALTTVLSGCRPGLLATKVTVVKNDLDPSSGYILVSEVTEFGRSTQEKLSTAALDSCFMSMDASMVDKGTLDTALETITTQMEALLAMP